MKRLIVLSLFISVLWDNAFAQGNALIFDGNDDYIQIDDYALSGEFTISFWYKAGDFNNGNFDDRIVAFGPTNRLEIGLGEANCGTENLWFYDEVANLQDCHDLNVRDGRWHHITFTVRGPNRIIYFDGNIIGGYLADTEFAYGPDLRIGAWTGALSTHTFFRGELDELRIWSEARTQLQIQRYMNCEMTGSEQCLDAYYSFNQGEAGVSNTLDSLFDQTGANRHGELRNFTLNNTISNWINSTADLSGECENVACLTTSTKDFDHLAVQVFPNPSQGLFELRVDIPYLARYRLSSISGQQIQEGFIDGDQILDLQNQPDGLYLLEIMVGESFHVTKLVKQRQ